MTRFLTILFAAFFLPMAALAQTTHWVQIEAHATLRTAEEFATRYQARIGNIAGFRIAGGWYALAVGPFATPEDAETRRQELLAAREIRADSYVTDQGIYGAQFWPVGGQALTQAPLSVEAPSAPIATPEAPVVVEAPAVAEVATPEAVEPQPAPEPEPEPEPAPEPEPEETVAEARANESRLTRDDRAAIQVALQWFGFYNSGIDAAFGPGTRRGIQDWQSSQGFEASGFLTTRQREKLIGDYEAALARYSFAPFRDESAGIEITLPLGMVAFDRHEAPFAHFNEINDSGFRVLLLSQEGTQATLFGLYEILQTLEIIPLDGERDRSRNSFLITGQGANARAHVEARLEGGAVKGWALLWGPSADADADLILSTMRQTFRPIDGFLPSSLGASPSAVSRRDLLSGLEVRRPERSRSGFFVDTVGTIVTSAEAVRSCDRVTIDEAYTAEIRALDEALGLAILTPQDPLVPLAFAQFAPNPPQPGSEIRVSGFSFEDTLSRPILTFGTLAELNGLNGEADLRLLTVETAMGDTGGPVFDGTGMVMGMLLPRPEMPGRMLPEDVNVAVSSDAIVAALQAAGLRGTVSQSRIAMPAEILTRMSGDLTVLVSCWN